MSTKFERISIVNKFVSILQAIGTVVDCLDRAITELTRSGVYEYLKRGVGNSDGILSSVENEAKISALDVIGMTTGEISMFIIFHFYQQINWFHFSRVVPF
jgi:hypothetical protein